MNSNLTTSPDTEGEYSFYASLYDVLTERRPIDVLFEHADFRRRAMHCCYLVARKWEEVDDLFQDACIRVLKYGHRLKPENIRDEDAFFAWFYVLTLHMYRDNWRSQRLQFDARPIQEIPVADLRINIEEQFLLGEFLEYSGTLSDYHRRAADYWLVGFSLREIERKLNCEGISCSHVTVGTWIKEAIDGFLGKEPTPVKKASGY